MPGAGFNVAVSAMMALQKSAEAHINNISNFRSTAFKSSGVNFSDNVYKTLTKAGMQENAEAAKRPVGVQIGTGTKVDGIYRVLTQGDFKRTDQPLDIALKGPGYFAVALPNTASGRAFTRAGSLQLDPATRRLTTINGEPLEGDITIPEGIPESAINISHAGFITATDPATNETVEIGQLQLFNFPNERGLESYGSNLLIETEGSGEAIPIDDLNNRFLQNYIETSNVSIIEELMQMMDIQKAEEAVAKGIKILDEMASEVNKIKS